MDRETQSGPVDRISQDYEFKIDYVKVDPVGGGGGYFWDDGIHDGIREIIIFSDETVYSISAVYDKNGGCIEKRKHGGYGGRENHIVLQYPAEYLQNVSGHYSLLGNRGHLVADRSPSPVIRSLTLKSNRQTYGPFGKEGGTPFTLPTQGGRIVGLTGRSSALLDSIGCHVRHITPRRLM